MEFSQESARVMELYIFQKSVHTSSQEKTSKSCCACNYGPNYFLLLGLFMRTRCETHGAKLKL